MKQKLNISKELLEQELLVNRKTVVSLAKELKCNTNSIYRRLAKYQLLEKVKAAHPYHHSFIDLTNQKFGKLTVKKVSKVKKWGKPIWICQCDCGKNKSIPASSLKRGFTTTCGSCERNNYKGYKEISKTYWTRVFRRSQEKSLSFDITPEFIWNLLEKQNFKCALSGIKIFFHHSHSKQTASIDRIDSSKGYIKDNVQLVHRTLNKIKNVFSNEELISWSKFIYQTHPTKAVFDEDYLADSNCKQDLRKE